MKLISKLSISLKLVLGLTVMLLSLQSCNKKKEENKSAENTVEKAAVKPISDLSIYNLPSKWMQAAGMRNVRIFASGNNLLTWAAYKNIDPEQPVNGVATWALPNLKSVTFGIEIGL